MANELLDFVMALVRDPEAAARYAADPGQAIADADLGDVTSADVNNLIPMVSDSLSMAAPAFGAENLLDDVIDSNVWTSGAATAAFDAFAPLAPIDTASALPDLGGVITVADEAPVADLSAAIPAPLEESALVNTADIGTVDEVVPDLWEQPVTDAHTPEPAPTAFDLFD